MISWTLKGFIKQYHGGKNKEYHEQFYDHKFDNLGEMEQFLERHKLPKLHQDTFNQKR